MPSYHGNEFYLCARITGSMYLLFSFLQVRQPTETDSGQPLFAVREGQVQLGSRRLGRVALQRLFCRKLRH
jgi:hypothetical protein